VFDFFFFIFFLDIVLFASCWLRERRYIKK